MAKNQKQNSLVKTFFKGLINNEAVMSGSKQSKWWVSLIIAVVSAFIPVIPIMVSTGNSYGASFLNDKTNGFDMHLASAVNALDALGDEFKVDENHQLIWYENNVKKETNPTPKTPLYEYVSEYRKEVKHEDESITVETFHQVELQVFYSSDPVNDKNADFTVQKLLSWLEGEEHTYVCDTTDIYTPVEGEDAPFTYIPSYLILYKDGIYTNIKGPNSTKSVAYTSFTSDWKHTKPGTELISSTIDVAEDDTTLARDVKNPEYCKGVLNNWKVYYNQAYQTQKSFNLGFSTLIYFGIYVVLIFFMGLMLFLLTRGKRNMFSYLTFFDTQKMAWWESAAPAILSLILGFFISQYAMMMFIVFLGMRTMWMSMRQLRPQA